MSQTQQGSSVQCLSVKYKPTPVIQIPLIKRPIISFTCCVVFTTFFWVQFTQISHSAWVVKAGLLWWLLTSDPLDSSCQVQPLMRIYCQFWFAVQYRGAEITQSTVKSKHVTVTLWFWFSVLISCDGTVKIACDYFHRTQRSTGYTVLTHISLYKRISEKDESGGEG